MGIPGGGVISLSAAPTRNSSPSEAPRAMPGRPAAMIAIATVSTPIPLDRVDTMLLSPFAEPSDDATFRPSPAAPPHRILPSVRRRSYTAFRFGDQYESALMTSPPAIEPRATQVFRLIEFLKNRTEPSASSEFTPLGCRLRDAAKLPPSFPWEKQGRFWPGWLSHRSPL